MDFEDNLRLVLSPEEQLPPHINLGQYYYQFVNGKRASEAKNASRFRTLTPLELDQLLRRLQDTPQQHVIEMNICYNYIGDITLGCSALAQALPHLSALQQLNLGCNLILLILFFD
jgi:hypothetical protein